jgi:hypothetical protein
VGGPFSTPGLDKVGELAQGKPNAFKGHGASLVLNKKEPRHRVLISETKMMLGDLTEENEETMKRKAATAIPPAGRNPGRIWNTETYTWEDENLPGRGGTKKAVPASSSAQTNAAQTAAAAPLTILDMQQIRAQKNLVEKGWKI